MALWNCEEKIKYLWRRIPAKLEGNQSLALETKRCIRKLSQEVRDRIDAVSAAAGRLSANPRTRWEQEARQPNIAAFP
jgi:hypothetical protein